MPPYSVTRHGQQFTPRFELETANLPGLEFNLDADDGSKIWLRVERLKEEQPPEAENEKLRLWLSRPENPGQNTFLKDRIEAVGLGGRIDESAAGEAPGRPSPAYVLWEELDDQDEITREFNNYLNNVWEPWAAKEKPWRKNIGFYADLFILYHGLQQQFSK